MSIAIEVDQIRKYYRAYGKPLDRLMHFFYKAPRKFRKISPALDDIMDQSQQLQRRGISILLASHDGAVSKRFCSRATCINVGSVRRIRASNEAVNEHIEWLVDMPNSFEPQPITGEASEDQTPLGIELSIKREMLFPNIDARVVNQRSPVGPKLCEQYMKPTNCVFGGAVIRLGFLCSISPYRGAALWSSATSFTIIEKTQPHSIPELLKNVCYVFGNRKTN